MPIIVSLAMDTAKVQHVTKKSSDELLRKFAEVGCEEPGKRRRKKRSEDELCDSDSPSTGGAALVERRSLLPSKVTRRRSVVLRQLRVRNKSSLFGSIHKTWRRTIEGASRVFLEKHYHPHKRLMNDIV
ncbi:unnamed protein product [Sphenostylis stenocarpa]|uniref:Uncharacterized protein n=1 Tax=Sphenostylis stenocarpa TaxID=92480 RepID=A0AA86VAN8_9FABA|nr:unnamed protein product [Sphenostylis stenocarpa]